MLSLNPTDITSFLRKHPSKDLPLMIHYWKLDLYENIENEEELFINLLKFGIGWNVENCLIKSKLGSEVIKTIYQEKEPITIVLKSHLLFESFIDMIFTENKICLNNHSFFSKTTILKNRKILNDDLANDLFLLNDLRNEYSHNYYFDIGELDMTKFSICKGLYVGLPLRRKNTRAVLNLKTLQYFVLINILDNLSNDFPYLIKARAKKNPHALFFGDAAEKIGKIITYTCRQINGSDVKLNLNIELSKNGLISIELKSILENKN